MLESNCQVTQYANLTRDDLEAICRRSWMDVYVYRLLAEHIKPDLINEILIGLNTVVVQRKAGSC